MPTETRKLVKARQKQVSELPQSLLCCELQRANMDNFAGNIYTVDLDTIKHDCTSACQFCDAEFECTKVRTMETGKYVYFECIDLDEGAYTDAH